MGKQRKQDKSNLLALALLLFSGFFILLYLLSGNNERKAPGDVGAAQSPDFEAKVNKHLFKTSQEIELSQQKMRIEADILANRGAGVKQAPRQEPHRLDFSTDPRAEALLRELGREARENSGPTSSDEEVQGELFEAQQSLEYSEVYKREYARQFIENARKAGYIIKLSDDYKVLSVKPLRKPADSYELFKNDGGGAK